jgi:hypothetical protein
VASVIANDPARIAAAIVIGAVLYAAVSTADKWINPSWPNWFGLLFPYTLVFGAVSAAVLFVNGIGLATSKQLTAGTPPEEVKAGRVLTALQFFVIYLGSLLILVSGAMWMEHAYAIRSPAGIFGLGGIAFLLASLKLPWWWFYTIRRLGWFALIPNDRAMQILLAGLGVALIVFSILIAR